MKKSMTNCLGLIATPPPANPPPPRPKARFFMVLQCAACLHFMHPTEPDWHGCTKADAEHAPCNNAHDYHWTAALRADFAEVSP